MSGVMKNKKITGASPVYQVSEEGGGLANVRLVRAVSKIRFVFCKSTTNPDIVTVNTITLGTTEVKVLPKTEYLFLSDAYELSTQKWKVGTEYEDATVVASNVDNSAIKQNDSPASYTYVETMTGQQYETLIQSGVDEGKLSDFGTFYLRESDKALTGTINYSITHTDKDGATTTTTKNATYAMHAVGDFSRNHTWIVYAYFVSSGDIIVGMVEVKNWEMSENTPYSVYNW